METFTWCPRINPTEDVSYNTRKVKFGDGYEQVSGNGLNSRSQKWAMEFVGDDNYISAIRHFIDKHAGIKSFSGNRLLSHLDCIVVMNTNSFRTVQEITPFFGFYSGI